MTVGSDWRLATGDGEGGKLECGMRRLLQLQQWADCSAMRDRVVAPP